MNRQYPTYDENENEERTTGTKSETEKFVIAFRWYTFQSMLKRPVYLTTLYVGMAIVRFPKLSSIYVYSTALYIDSIILIVPCNILRTENPLIFCVVFTIVLRVFSVRLFKRNARMKADFPIRIEYFTMLLFYQMDDEQIKANFSESKEKIPNFE